MSAIFASPPGSFPDVVRAGEDDDHLRVHAIELAVLDAPEHVLDPVGAPAEVGRVPAGEVLAPVGEELRIVRRAPAARDRVALEVDVDLPLRALREQLLVREPASSRRCAASACRRATAPRSRPQRSSSSRRDGAPRARHGARARRGHRRRCGIRPLELPVGPLEIVLPVRRVRVTAVVLPPRELAVEQPDVHRRHLRRPPVVRHAEILRAEQAEHRLRRDGRHEAALMIEPLRVALLRNAVAHERQPRRAERDQLVRIDGELVRRVSPRARRVGAVLQVVPRHPVVLARAGETLHRLAEVAAVQRRAPFARRADEHHREARIERHRHQRGLAVPRHALRCRPASHPRPCRSRGNRARATRPTPTRAARPSRPACAAARGSPAR